ncbi:MAG TPA: phosphopantetheine-binding protein [Acidobacteriaceae bacterium]|nr:phosphopantetheine-binding protein [Acidobacteriaceae bacterium]
MQDTQPQIQESRPTPTEEKLIALWEMLLNVPSVTAADDFLDLGGDSLAAVMCISRIRQVFQVEVSFDEFFNGDATVSRFAMLIDEALKGKDMRSVI